MFLRSFALLTAAAALTACSSATTAATDSVGSAAQDRLAVSVGFYPYQFVAEAVGGEDVVVTNLTQPGGEPHDLELTPQQVVGLSTSDLVVYSRGFQPAVDAAVEQQAADRALDVLTAVDLLEAAPHEGEGHEGEQELAGDPHVWLDPMRLATIAQAVADELAALAPEDADAFQQRAADLGAELEALDGELRTGLSTCQRTEIVTSHDAYGYLAAAYGLEQASVAGLTPDAEASPQRLAEVAAFARETGTTTIFFEETVSPAVAETLAREVGAVAVLLSPLEGAPETGDYVSTMQTNLATLRTALDCA